MNRRNKTDYYKEADSIVFVFDVCYVNAFENLQELISDVEKLIFNFIPTCLFFNQFLINKIWKNYIIINRNISENVHKVLIGNKTDKEEDRVITNEQGIEYAQNHGMNYFETSAKTGFNVDETFKTITRNLISKS